MKTLERQNIKAYLDLIQGLLSCPQGEEWILLRKHGELVNSELVDVMEQVANHLAGSGDIKAAKYLHNWAGKLHHILTENLPVSPNDQDKIHAYTELIQALLSCPEGAESEILTAHQELVDPELIRVMNQVAHQMAARDPESANYLYTLAADLDRTWIEHHEFEPTYKPEIAPDPWLEENDEESSSNQDLSVTKSDLDEPAEITDRETEEQAPLPTQSQVELKESLIPLLTKVADSLTKLETILAAQTQTQNPLWYMDVLEQAIAANWILTTDEVEKLIGVKPHCHHDETDFYRGNWIFVKTEKIGLQTGWKVQKKTDFVD